MALHLPLGGSVYALNPGQGIVPAKLVLTESQTCIKGAKRQYRYPPESVFKHRLWAKFIQTERHMRVEFHCQPIAIQPRFQLIWEFIPATLRYTRWKDL